MPSWFRFIISMCSVNQICPRPRTPLVGLPRFPANAAHADGDFPKGAAMDYMGITNSEQALINQAPTILAEDENNRRRKIPSGHGGFVYPPRPRTLAEAKYILLRLRWINPKTGCWHFCGSRSKAGYGTMGFKRGKVLVHRFSWRVFRGRIGKKHVLHQCDNPPCFNPRHLFKGTHRDNMLDAMSKGILDFRKMQRLGVAARRANGKPHPIKGELVKSSKLTASNVIEIRKRYSEGVLRIRLAERFHVTLSNICQICSGKGWRHLCAA